MPEPERRGAEADFMRQFAQRITLLVLRGYKWMISPLFPPACRYVPTCSEYAMEAIERYGVLRGGFLAIQRLLRCHPFVKGGYDPVVQGASCYEHSAHDTCNSALGQDAT